jgi:hypothetical protein
MLGSMSFQDVLDAFQSVAIIIAAAVAVWGINAWRREFLGKRRIDLAEEALASFYEASEMFAVIRSPLGYVGEGSTRESSPDEDPEDKKRLDRAFVVYERYNKNSEPFRRLQTLKYRCTAQFGESGAAPFDEFIQILNDIFSASTILIDYSMEEGRAAQRSEEEYQQHVKERRSYDAIVYDRFERNDPIRPRIDSALRKADSLYGDLLGERARQSWWKLWE